MNGSPSTSASHQRAVGPTGPSPGAPRVAPDRGDLIVRAAFARLDPVALAAGTGALFALGLWALTAILLLKGPSADAVAAGHAVVGPHLALLGNFLPGYTVSWAGSVVGLFYGLLIGAVFGSLVATFWNTVHHIVLVTVLVRRNFSSDL